MAPSRVRLVAGAVLVVAGCLVYANGLSAPFVFDDHTAIVTNQQIRQVFPLSASLSPPPETPVNARPLINLSLAVNYAAGGLDVRGYHVTNLIIHLVATLVLFGVVRRTLELETGESVLRVQAENVAFASAMIWMLHPLQTEIVNYVTQRTTSLKGLLLLATLYCSIRALGPSRRRWQWAAVLSCAAGMACKESMVVAPLLVALYDRVFVYASVREAVARRGRLYAGLAGTWIVLGALMASQPRSTVGFETGVGAWTYLLNQAAMIAQYLRLAAWPRGLVLDYGLPQPLALADVLVPALAVTGLGMATLVALVRWPRLGFLGAWFFIALSPTSSVVPIATEVGAERRMYLPLAAVVVLIVCGAVLVTAGSRRLKVLGVAAFLGVCVWLGAGTILRNDEYRSPLALAETVVERRPHGRAHLRFGAALVDAGRRGEAIEHFRRAKRLNATGARYALGIEYVADGDLNAGIVELTQFVQRHPAHVNVVPARELLGRAYLAQGLLDEAAGEFTEVLREAPNFLAAHAGLGDIRLAQHRPGDAVPHLEYVTAAQPRDVNALGKLGTALAASRRIEEAVAVFAAAVAADPRHPRARTMLGRALAADGRVREALVQFEEAATLAPGSDEARLDLEAARQQLARAAASGSR
jgi:tetratricopeptide (TPR) repeat protein